MIMLTWFYLQAPYKWTETSILPENAGDTYRQMEAAQYNGRGGAVCWFAFINLSLQLHFAELSKAFQSANRMSENGSGAIRSIGTASVSAASSTPGSLTGEGKRIQQRVAYRNGPHGGFTCF